MYIKRIDLKGFKTFQHKVSLNLDRGMTVITGPNGGGKSNIMDAVKFALGELSPKEMRGASFEDLISKTSQATSSKSAYVAIQFENSDRRIPIDSDAVTVSRQFAKGGEGIYRVNGRRVSRKQVHDALSSAGISVSGLNIIPQHTITRLADVTSEERRRIIEDMIGIGIYDAKKAEAAVQLQQADINIRVASAKVDEVRSRVEDLERERNDLLRSKYLKEEINRLQAEKISYQISTIDEEINDLRNQFTASQTLLNQIKSEREEVTTEKARLDEEKRRFEQEVLDKGNERLFDLERRISDSVASSVRLKSEKDSIEEAHRSLQTRVHDLHNNIEETTKKVSRIKNGIHELDLKRDQVKADLRQREVQKNQLLNQIRPIRERFAEMLAEYEEGSSSLNEGLRQKTRIEAVENTHHLKLQLLQEKLRQLNERKNECEKTISYSQNKINDLTDAIDLNRREIATLKEKISQHRSLIASREQDVQQAQETIRKAKQTIMQACAQRDAQEGMNPEERAYSVLGEMARTGKLQSSHGRLRDHLTIPHDYLPAIEAAADGWLNALIVENLEDAVSCINVLKRQKIGRAKIIPLSSILTTKAIHNPEGVGAEYANAGDLVSCEDKIKPAVNFVLGDTFVARSEKDAFILSLNGVRAVAQSGDVFEPEGGIEGGYYRNSFDLWNLATADEVSDLERMVNSLEELGNRNQKDIEHIRIELNESLVAASEKENLNLVKENELKEVANQLKSLKTTFEEIQRQIRQTQREESQTEDLIRDSQQQKKDLDEQIRKLRPKIETSRAQIETTNLRKAESAHEDLAVSLERLNRTLIETEGNIQTLHSNLQLLTETQQETTRQTQELQNRAREYASILEKKRSELEESDKKLAALNEERRALISQITAAKNSRRSFDQQLGSVEEKLKTLYRDYEQQSTALTQLGTRLREREMEKTFLYRDLKNLNFQTPLQVAVEEIANTNTLIELLRKELDDIGAVNELAFHQYDEYKENYRHLSIRINELEEEKVSILRFMNELDEKKKDAFMNAFRQVNQNFHDIFSVVIEGGSGRLVLENEEDPFAGGIEVLLRFPKKAEFSISGASGGERSVATVCFIIALQAIHPMPFYMFDEIDAHLDPLNSQRLADELKKRSQGSQFILISLKDTTVSRADKVYGVYIETGSSKVVALPIREAAP